MDAVAYAVYVWNPRRGRYALASRPNADRSVTAASEAAQRQNAYIVPGTNFPASLTPEEVAERTGLDVPGLKPVASD